MASGTNGHSGGLATAPAKQTDGRAALLAKLRPLERLFGDCEWPERGVFLQARRRAREHALEVLDGGSCEDEARTALLVAATELFGALGAARAVSPGQAADLVERLEDGLGVSRAELAREVLRAPELLSLPPAVAIEAQLGMLMAFAPLRSASLWRLEAAERINCAWHVGEGAQSRGAQQLARQLLAGQRRPPGERRLLLGFAVEQWEQPVAALVGCANPGGGDRGRALMSEALPMLAAIVQRGILLAGNAASERALVASSERKLTRLGFDLHDGPIQDVALLGEDLRLFRDQLELVLGPLSDNKLVRGRIEDLDAQLVAIDSELRRLSTEVQAASVLLQRPFRDALRDRIQAFAARTGIRPRLTLTGEASLSTSQQIALLNIIQEALSNIREHASASKVEITVSASRDRVEATVTDDGRGFDLESTLMRAAREGRIGLLAMNERVRLLGGQCRIDSSPGGPTVVSVALEPWLPLAEEARSREDSPPSSGRKRRSRAAA